MNRTGFRSRALGVAAMTVALLVAAAQSAFAIPGDLDGTFDGDGKANFDHNGGIETGRDVAVGPGGKLYIAGNEGNDVLVLRVKPGGTVDTDYGDGGFAVLDIGSDNDHPEQIQVMPDGSAFVAGQTHVADLQQGFLAKFTPDGDPAASFGGGDGFVTIKNGSDDVYITALLVQSSGKVVVGGETDPTDTSSHFYMERRKANGALDTTFGTGGRTETSFGQGFDAGWKLGAQQDGRLVFGGWTEEGVGTSEFDTALARYSANGLLDRSFGKKGKVVISLFDGGDDYVNALEVMPNDKLAICLNASDGLTMSYLAVMRLLATGKVDTRFGGGDGTNVLAQPNGESCHDLALQDDGKIVITGFAGPSDRFAAIRFKAGGRIDRTFGGDGIASADFGTTALGTDAIAVQPNGMIVVVGAVNAGTSDVAVARFLA